MSNRTYDDFNDKDLVTTLTITSKFGSRLTIIKDKVVDMDGEIDLFIEFLKAEGFSEKTIKEYLIAAAQELDGQLDE